MAKARVTMTCPKCGKEYEWTSMQYNRSAADRWEAWAKNQTDRICPHCYAKEREEEEIERRKVVLAKAETVASDLNLPCLTGTPRQVAWAMTIRDEYIQERVDNKENAYRTALLEEIRTQDAAEWWIGNRLKLALAIEPNAQIRLYRTKPTEDLVRVAEDLRKWLADNADKEKAGFVMKIQFASNKDHLDRITTVLNERNVA